MTNTLLFDNTVANTSGRKRFF